MVYIIKKGLNDRPVSDLRCKMENDTQILSQKVTESATVNTEAALLAGRVGLGVRMTVLTEIKSASP